MGNITPISLPYICIMASLACERMRLMTLHFPIAGWSLDDDAENDAFQYLGQLIGRSRLLRHFRCFDVPNGFVRAVSSALATLPSIEKVTFGFLHSDGWPAISAQDGILAIVQLLQSQTISELTTPFEPTVLNSFAHDILLSRIESIDLDCFFIQKTNAAEGVPVNIQEVTFRYKWDVTGGNFVDCFQERLAGGMLIRKLGVGPVCRKNDRQSRGDKIATIQFLLRQARQWNVRELYLDVSTWNDTLDAELAAYLLAPVPLRNLRGLTLYVPEDMDGQLPLFGSQLLLDAFGAMGSNLVDIRLDDLRLRGNIFESMSVSHIAMANHGRLLIRARLQRPLPNETGSAFVMRLLIEALAWIDLSNLFTTLQRNEFGLLLHLSRARLAAPAVDNGLAKAQGVSLASRENCCRRQCSHCSHGCCGCR
ncbi:hypothetical protein MPSEU_000822700 [Mayamaea pseudoterrestris]|nr:hypothetical protein MPSEU_000822700 [Mayamaea pseudoterrestris]